MREEDASAALELTANLPVLARTLHESTFIQVLVQARDGDLGHAAVLATLDEPVGTRDPGVFLDFHRGPLCATVEGALHMHFAASLLVLGEEAALHLGPAVEGAGAPDELAVDSQVGFPILQLAGPLAFVEPFAHDPHLLDRLLRVFVIDKVVVPVERGATGRTLGILVEALIDVVVDALGTEEVATLGDSARGCCVRHPIAQRADELLVSGI